MSDADRVFASVMDGVAVGSVFPAAFAAQAANARVDRLPYPAPVTRPRNIAAADRSALGAFALMVTIAGGNAVAIRYISCETCELEPFWAAGMRFLLAASIFAGIALFRRAGVPRGRAFLGCVLYGTLAFAGTFGFAYWGLVRASAGIGAVLLATVPLLTFVLATAHGQERFRWGGLAGGALSLGGIAVIFGEGIGAGVPVMSLLSLLAGAVCFAEAAIVVKAFPRVHPAAMNSIAMAVGGGVMLVLAIVLDEELVAPQLTSTWVAQAYLVILGSVLVFALYLYVLQRWTASAVSYEGVLIPLVTILLSAWLQDERITPGFVAGSVLVLIGVYVGALRPASRARAIPHADPG